MVLVAALLWAFCGRALPGRRLELVVQSCCGNSAVNRSVAVVQTLCLTMSRTHSLTRSLAHSLISSPLYRQMNASRRFLPALLCSQSQRIILLSSPPAPLYLTSSSHISLSLTCSLSHARAQPRSSFLYRSTDSAHPSSSPLLLLSLTPFLLLITQCLL